VAWSRKSSKSHTSHPLWRSRTWIRWTLVRIDQFITCRLYRSLWSGLLHDNCCHIFKLRACFRDFSPRIGPTIPPRLPCWRFCPTSCSPSIPATYPLWCYWTCQQPSRHSGLPYSTQKTRNFVRIQGEGVAVAPDVLGLTWSRLGEENISRAAAFSADCSRFSWYIGMPTNVALP